MAGSTLIPTRGFSTVGMRALSGNSDRIFYLIFMKENGLVRQAERITELGFDPAFLRK